MHQGKSYSVEEALQRLMAYCAYRDRSQKEVEDKLIEMRMIPQAREKIIIKLMEENFLSEERFARSFVRGKFRIKHWGRLKIRQELKKRGIAEPILRLAFQEIDPDEYEEVLCEITDKKLRTLREKNPYKKKQKLYNYLISRGFESEVILEVIAQRFPQ